MIAGAAIYVVGLGIMAADGGGPGSQLAMKPSTGLT